MIARIRRAWGRGARQTLAGLAVAVPCRWKRARARDGRRLQQIWVSQAIPRHHPLADIVRMTFAGPSLAKGLPTLAETRPFTLSFFSQGASFPVSFRASGATRRCGCSSWVSMARARPQSCTGMCLLQSLANGTHLLCPTSLSRGWDPLCKCQFVQTAVYLHDLGTMRFGLDLKLVLGSDCIPLSSRHA